MPTAPNKVSAPAKPFFLLGPIRPAIAWGIIAVVKALVWSAGRDGKHDRTNPDAEVNRDNVCSW